MAIMPETTIDEVVDLYPDTWEVFDEWEITLTPAVRRSTIRELCAARALDLSGLLEDIREFAETYEDWDEED